MLSYWEQQSFVTYNHIVVGAGIVGLSTAIELKEKHPTHRVLVAERGLLPTGASSRNAGFACMGSLTEILDDSTHSTEDKIVKLYEWRKKGLELLRGRLGDAAIGYKNNGSYELIGHKELAALESMDYINDLLLPVTKQPAFKRADNKIGEFGFGKTQVKALIENTCEGEIDTGKMLRALTDYALMKGVEIKTGAVVSRFEEEANSVTVLVKDPIRQTDIALQCDTLYICTNAFAKQLLPDEEVIPGRGQILITAPILDLKWKGIFHFDKGYYYFREIDGRVLLGGGRNLDFEGEATTELALTDVIQNDLEEKLRTIIIPNTAFVVSQRWAGIMAFGNTKQPIIKAFSKRVYGAFRMGGMGVALGSDVARQVVALSGDKS